MNNDKPIFALVSLDLLLAALLVRVTRAVVRGAELERPHRQDCDHRTLDHAGRRCRCLDGDLHDSVRATPLTLKFRSRAAEASSLLFAPD